ncbi:hypothetical protein DE146DRAFT_640153 [Phaeosphaeria sp. MPI-PUGE-AT-0046c]|nr:hypothetical protein DE146DRAFT_640153 [Phaeosphaeria sp. MPI-PUGE-AT-0046c]
MFTARSNPSVGPRYLTTRLIIIVDASVAEGANCLWGEGLIKAKLFLSESHTMRLGCMIRTYKSRSSSNSSAVHYFEFSTMSIPKLQLRFLVIGGGLAGVSAAIALARNGHHVTVLEAQQAFSEVGAGIQVPPNATRILDQWGLLSRLLDYATSPLDIQFRSYGSGQILSVTPLIPDLQTRYHSPHLVLHRADLLSVLVDEARRLNVELRTGCAAAEIDFSARTVRTVSGHVFTGDIIVGADGEKSSTRNLAQGQDTAPETTGRLVYRLTVNSDLMMTEKSTRDLVHPPRITCWLGPDMHILCYNLESRDVCNVVFSRADDTPTQQRLPGPQLVAMEEMRRIFPHWDEPLRRMLDLAESAVYWPALKGRDIDTWSHRCGSFILIGDAAHTMPPHL